MPDFREEEIHVRIDEDDENVTISFFLGGEVHTMNREKQEVMVKTLKRMAATFKKKESKGPKKSKPLKKSQLPLVTGEEVGVQDIRVESDTVVVMDQNGGAVDVETMQNYQWQSGMQLSYKTAMFHIVVNPPLVTAISIFPKQMVLRDYPVVPTVSTEFADGVQYEWYRETDDKDFVSVGRQQVFTPTADSIGKRLKVYCTPYRRVAAGCVALNQQSGAASEAGGGSAGGLETAFESLVITACTEPESTPGNYIYGRTMTCYLSGTVRDAARAPKILEVRSGYLAVRRFSDDRDNNKDFRIPVTVPEADASATSSSSSSAYNPYSRYEIYAPFSACNNIAGPSKDVSSHNYGSSSSVREADELRMVSYNILAEPFATSDYAVKHMFGYCPLEYLETDYRMQLILRELLAYDADVLCLQECDAKVFKLYLQPALMLRGYSGSYLNKSSGVLEGCATFTRDSALVVLRRVDLPMKNVLRHAPYLQGIYALRPDLQDVLGGKLGTVVQFTVCQSVCDGRVIIFANTHLFYHPAAAFVRLAQTDLILRVATEMKEYITKNGVKEFMKSYRHPGEEPAAVEEDEGRGGDPGGLELSSGDNAKESKPVNKVSIVFMGDLNSTPETGVNELLHSGYIAADHVEWSSVNDFRWGARAGEVEESAGNDNDSSPLGEPATSASSSSGKSAEDRAGTTTTSSSSSGCVAIDAPTPQLCHNMKFLSSAGFPEFTNYTAGFKDLLDYIYIDGNDFEVVRVAPFPTPDELDEFKALPSKVFPSDHLAVAVDLKLI